MTYRERLEGRAVAPQALGRHGCGRRDLLHAHRHRGDAGRFFVVAGPPRHARLGHAVPAGGRRLSLALRRRAPLAVVAALGALTLTVTLLIWPAGAPTPAHAGNVWAPYATTLAA